MTPRSSGARTRLGGGATRIRIEHVATMSEALVSGVHRLVAELEPAPVPQTRRRLRELLARGSCRLLVAYASDTAMPAGVLLLVWYPMLTGRHFWIEDVAVSPEARGRGIGEALVRHALKTARGLGAPHVDLTCRPSREAANRLYLRLGFERRDTNVYRYHLRSGHSR